MTKPPLILDLRSQEVLDFCAAAALYSEAIEHREGRDGGVRFLQMQFGITERSARDLIAVGRGIVGEISVPRKDWDEARAAIAVPLMERMEARLVAEGRMPGRRATGGRSRPGPS